MKAMDPTKTNRVKAMPVLRPVRAGFTLLELLVVIVILAVLAAMIATGARRGFNKAYEASCMQNLHHLGIALISYAGDNRDTFPGILDVSGNGSYFGEQSQLIEALKGYGMEAPEGWYCKRYIKHNGLNMQDEWNNNMIGYFYWAWRLVNGNAIPMRVSDNENIWNQQGWNDELPNLVLMSDRFRDKNAWAQPEDWQYHGGMSVDVPLEDSGTHLLLLDGSVIKAPPRSVVP